MSKSSFSASVARTAVWVLVCAGLSGLRVETAAAAGCTDGVDCYCDRVNDTSLLWCEDFEHPDYYENTAMDWATSQPGAPGDRGLGSKWVSLYGPSGAAYWTRGNPASPKIGNVCSPSGQVCGPREYCSAAQSALVLGSSSNDCWDGNSGSAIDVQRTGDYRAELANLTLSGGSGTTSDVGAGKQHMAYRVQAGNTAGIVGGKKWTAVTDLGVTSLVAYSSNLASTGILNDFWKGNEWGDYPYAEWWTNGNMLNIGSAATFPFRNFFWTSVDQATCSAAIAGKVLVGTATCDGGKLYFGAKAGTGTGLYNQPTDWPFGTWGCVQGQISGMGTANVVVKVWLNEKLVIHIAGLNGAVLHNKNYDAVYWNNYSNANQAGGVATTQTSFRYEDNVHIRRGAPVSCSAVGFGSPAPSGGAPAPTSLAAPILLP